MFGGGKGMGGGGIVRVVTRTVTGAGLTNLQEPISSNSATTSPSINTHKPGSCNNTSNISLSSVAAYNDNNIAVSGNFVGSSCDEYEWISVDGSCVDDEIGFEVGDDYFLGPVPSSDEVHSAVSALKRELDSASYSNLIRDKFTCEADQISSLSSLSGIELDWREPTLSLNKPRMLQSGSHRVYDAFHLLQNDPTVQKMVISLSSDKAVWDAVLNNEVVRELRETYQADENITLTSETSNETVDDLNPASDFIKWIFDNTQAKVMEIFDKISKLMNELLITPSGVKGAAESKDPFEEKLRTSFLLSVVVLLVVVVTRASSQKA